MSIRYGARNVALELLFVLLGVVALFPIYILLARLSLRPPWYEIITVWSLLFLALFAGLFACGRWAF